MLQDGLRQPLESFIRLETADDETTLVAKDSSLVTLIAIEGATQIIGDTSNIRSIVEQCYIEAGMPVSTGQARLCRSISSVIRIRTFARHEVKLIRPTRLTAKIIGLDLDDLLDEREK